MAPRVDKTLLSPSLNMIHCIFQVIGSFMIAAVVELVVVAGGGRWRL